jgi:hypothetical protein
MSQNDSIARWQICEEVRLTALKNSKQDRKAHYAAQEEARKIWNDWANDIIKARQDLESQGLFKLEKFTYEAKNYVGRETLAGNDDTAGWLDRARADSSGITFESRPNFRGFIFPGQAIFGESKGYTPYTMRKAPKPCVTFLDGARFDQAIFHLDAVFDWALFQGSVGFGSAHFCEIARFDQCVFAGTTWFHHAVFRSDLWMGQVKFKGYADFSDAIFKGPSSFYAAQSEGAFILNGASFEEIPDFTQARFQGTPRIDSKVIPPMPFFPKLNYLESRDVQGRYLAIRQLAVAGHDHQNEAKAFKAEMRAKRGADHRWWNALFWFSTAYDAASDFGQSMMRPFLIWVASILAFTVIYLAHGAPNYLRGRRFAPMARPTGSNLSF